MSLQELFVCRVTYSKTAAVEDNEAPVTCVMSFPNYVWRMIPDEDVCTITFTVFCEWSYPPVRTQFAQTFQQCHFLNDFYL